MKVKKTNTTTKKKKVAKTGTTGIYLNSWRFWPLNKSAIMNLSERLMHWADTNEDAFSIDQFLKEQKISRTRFYVYIKQHEELKEANDFAKMCIGVRREIGGLKRKLDATMVSMVMPHYSHAWKEVIEWKASLKNKEDLKGATSTISVIMQEAPKSSLVPERTTE